MSGVIDLVVAHANVWASTALLCIGLWIVMVRGNLFKKVVGLNILQTGVFLFYISLSWVEGGTAPIKIADPGAVYANPLPHVLILTAIVVSVSISSLALALIVRINEAYGSVEEDDIVRADEA